MAAQFQTPKDLVISYLTIRRSIGFIALLLPVALIILPKILYGCNQIHISFSDYYHTGMRNLFVGALSAVSLFLFSYKGTPKGKIKWENIFGNLGGFFCLGVVLFPTSSACGISCNTITSTFLIPPFDFLTHCFSTIHFTSAICFFIVLMIFSFKLFQEELKDDYDEHQIKITKRRNVVFKVCAIIMLISIVIAGFCLLSLGDECDLLRKYKPVFYAELVALWAFGVSWIVKGQLFWKDVDTNYLN